MVHGGHCIARHEGRVVFVRHAVPGETVRVALTESAPGAKFWRADVVEVLEASDHRRRHPWRAADSLAAYERNLRPVGGAEYGHITEAHQRRLKAQVFRDTLARIGDITLADCDLPSIGADGELHVTALHNPDGGLHWRTRVSFDVDETGHLAMKPHRSHDLIGVTRMPLAVEAIDTSGIFSWDFSGAQRVDVVAPAGEQPLTLVIHAEERQGLGEAGSAALRQQAQAESTIGSIILAHRHTEGVATSGAGRRRRSQLRPTRVRYEVLTGERTITEPLPVCVPPPGGAPSLAAVELPPEAFWQIHRAAPQTLTEAAQAMSGLETGARAVDLYAGAGLFTAWAAATVGTSGRVLSVEAAEGASAAAERLFTSCETVEVVRSPVEKIAADLPEADLIILDPPRAGAGRGVIEGIDAAAPQQILYISCDPASFARDAKQLTALGWRLADIRVFDMYPNTHHMESAAIFTSPR